MPIAWLVAAALAQEEAGAPVPEPEPTSDPRDDEIFGPAPTAPPTPTAPTAPPTPTAPEPAPAPPTTGDRDEDLLGGGFETSEDRMADTLLRLDDRFTIGGRLWVLAQGNVPEGVEGADQVTLDGPTRLDLYADARPNERVRAYASGRLTHDFTVRKGDLDPFTGEEITPDTVLLDQLWLKFDIGRRVFVTAGKQRVRWGTGRFWNPTDFLNQQRLDPLAIVDVRTGVDLVKVHLPIESANSNLYAIAVLQDAQALDQIGGALRGETSFGQTELTASAAVRKDQPVRLGADLSSGLGPLDVSLEAAVQHGVTAPRWEGSFDAVTFEGPTEVDVSDEWLGQVVGGVEVAIPYGGDDSFSIGAQGFYNDLGYDDAELLPWLFVVGQYQPLYFGRAYAGGYLFLPAPGKLDEHTFLASALANVSDGSVVLRGDWRVNVLRFLDVSLFGSWYGGANGELHYELEVPATTPGDEPLVVPAPLATVGISGIVRF